MRWKTGSVEHDVGNLYGLQKREYDYEFQKKKWGWIGGKEQQRMGVGKILETNN